MDVIEKALEESGERWRSDQPVLEPTIVATALARPSRGANAGRGLIAFASVLVAIGIIMLGAAAWRPPLHASAAGPSWSATVNPGDHVVGAGTIFAADGKPVMLCRPLSLDALRLSLGPDSSTPCSTIQIELSGIDLSSVLGATRVGNAVIARNISVRGIWNGSAVEVDSVGLASEMAQPDDLQPFTCTDRAPGAVAEGDPSLEVEAAFARLQSLIDGDRDNFGGTWPASAGGSQVMVVATVSDGADVVSRIRGVFPYDFCVVHVDYSASELDRAMTAFGQVGGYEAATQTDANRVVVDLPVLDVSAAALVKMYPSAVLRPLIALDVSPNN